MPAFQITVRNEKFVSTIDAELDDMAAAQAQALKGVLDVGAEEVLQGKIQ